MELRRRTACCLPFALVLAVLAGCPAKRPAPTPIVRTAPLEVAAEPVLRGVMKISSGDVAVEAVPRPADLERRFGLVTPPDSIAVVVSVTNDSRRDLILNPGFDQWSVAGEDGLEVQATPATVVKLGWFLDRLSAGARLRAQYPERVERGKTVRFPIYVPEKLAPNPIVEVRYANRQEDGRAYVRIPRDPLPVPVTGTARVEELKGSAHVEVGPEHRKNPLALGSHVRGNDVIVVEAGSEVVLLDEGTEQAYSLIGPEHFVLEHQP